MNKRCPNPKHDVYCPGIGVGCIQYNENESKMMKATLSLTQEDIANAVVAWLHTGNVKADPSTFFLGVTKGDRDYESDSYYANIKVEVEIKK